MTKLTSYWGPTFLGLNGVGLLGLPFDVLSIFRGVSPFVSKEYFTALVAFSFLFCVALLDVHNLSEFSANLRGMGSVGFHLKSAFLFLRSVFYIVILSAFFRALIDSEIYIFIERAFFFLVFSVVADGVFRILGFAMPVPDIFDNRNVVFGGNFFNLRASGFMVEAGDAAFLALNLFSVLLWKGRIRGSHFLSIFLVFVFTKSSILILMAPMMVYGLWSGGRFSYMVLAFSTLVVFSFMFFLWNNSDFLVYSFYRKFMQVFDATDLSSSGSRRGMQWRAGYDLIVSSFGKPYGLGSELWAVNGLSQISTGQTYGAKSAALQFLIEGGVVAWFVFAWMLRKAFFPSFIFIVSLGGIQSYYSLTSLFIAFLIIYLFKRA